MGETTEEWIRKCAKEAPWASVSAQVVVRELDKKDERITELETALKVVSEFLEKQGWPPSTYIHKFVIRSLYSKEYKTTTSD